MYIPPEVILNILDHLDHDGSSQDNDRETLRTLRLVSKDFYGVVSTVLFRYFSLNYGVARSVVQMRGVVESPLLSSSIKTLCLPSESFFPLGKEVWFNQSERFPWSRGNVLPSVYPDGMPVRKGAKGRRNHNDQTFMLHYPFREFPTRPWAPFTLNKKEFKEQHARYTKELRDLLAACTNLEEVHVAFGLGWETERMNCWGTILGSILLPAIASSGVKKLKMLMPSPWCLGFLLRGYAGESYITSDQIPDFPNLKSLETVSLYSTNITAFGEDIAGFLARFTGLTSFADSTCKPLKSQRWKFLSPINTTSQNLTTLKLSYIFLSQVQPRGPFLEHLEKLPSLTHLILDTICLDASQRHSQPAPITWGNFFQHIMASLPNLTDFTFRRLMYGREGYWGWWKSIYDFSVFLPSAPEEGPVLEYLKKRQIVSPHDSDYSALENLARIVNRRREKTGLKDLDYDGAMDGVDTNPRNWRYYESTLLVD
ncbi:hypothetical protein H072_10191 [Dactylellina haptotyla CBS 200.50]|uniref:F-box domain-containing protein n=1 Tax=Dactylellina haptotyla (strain CBS 200.50) TaxID=1284197 RepID=S8BM34_DACHA|nr:hypothetical protein H072_10191 [Dactylellina haptotyla CBS 200.50]